MRHARIQKTFPGGRGVRHVYMFAGGGGGGLRHIFGKKMGDKYKACKMSIYMDG